MVTKAEAAKLLTVASGFDRFISVDDVTVGAWTLALQDVYFETAKRRLVAWYRHDWDGRTQLNPRVLTGTFSEALADTCAARAYGIVPRDTPDNRPLTVGEAQRLAEARRAASDVLAIQVGT